MKNITSILLASVLLGLVVVPTRADKTNDQDFTRRLLEIFDDCQKVKSGMTRTELVKLDLFDEDRGPMGPLNDKSFKQHTTFAYRACSFIEIDIDFSPSDSKEARPTDIIAKVSMPFIDARARR